jgi:hypothetical protein
MLLVKGLISGSIFSSTPHVVSGYTTLIRAPVSNRKQGTQYEGKAHNRTGKAIKRNRKKGMQVRQAYRK